MAWSETETLDKLFLELAQFTTAVTPRERKLGDALGAILREYGGALDVALKTPEALRLPMQVAMVRGYELLLVLETWDAGGRV
jgi:hypothetical protein